MGGKSLEVRGKQWSEQPETGKWRKWRSEWMNGKFKVEAGPVCGTWTLAD